MRSKKAIVFISGLLMMILLVSGCKGKAAPPNIDAQKKVINNYMQGLKEGNKDKVLSAVSPDAATQYQVDPDSMKQILEAQKKMGSLKEWKFKGDPYVDEVNNQSLIYVTAIYPRNIYQLKFDLRRMNGQWGVLAVKMDDSNKKSKMSTSPMN